MTLYVGTSGWAYKEWKPGFYPDRTPQSRFLQHYASVLDACEINNTFYRTPPDTTVQKWVNETPESFRFAVKAHRMMTYLKVLEPTPERKAMYDDFFRAASLLGPRLGPILLQVPKYHQRDDSDLTALMDALPATARAAFEFIDPSWDSPEVYEAIAARGHTVCLTERESIVPAQLPAGDFAYARLRGEGYEEGTREKLYELLASEAADRDVYVFTKHKGGAPGDPSIGIGLAVWLTSLR
jgi:uncharacterized protein YecE (DUF72 family)